MSIDNNIDFKDHIVQYPNRFKQTTVAPGIVELVPTWIETPEQIIQPGTPVDSELFKKLKQNVTIYQQTFTTTENQTVINLNRDFLVGQNRVSLSIGGVRQYAGQDYTETDTHTLTMTTPQKGGLKAEVIMFTASQAIAEDFFEKTMAAIEATQAANTAASAANDAADAALSAALNWRTPVDTYSQLASVLSPKVRDTIMTRDTGKVYRYNGTVWVEIQDINPTAINDLEARLTKTVNEYAYNLDKGLAGYRSKPLPQIVFWGDSITNGAGAGFLREYVRLFADAIQIRDGMYGMGYFSFNVSSTGWDLQTEGTNRFRVVSNSTAALAVTSNNPFAIKLDILYSKETDGGTFEVLSNGSVLATGNSAGTKSYHNILTVDVPAKSTVTIRPVGKAYIEGYTIYGNDGMADGTLVHKVGHPGFAAQDYSYAEIKASIVPFSPDLTVVSMIANDYSRQNLTAFEDKIRYAVQQGKLSGDVLIMPHGQISHSYTSPSPMSWEDHVAVLRKIAREENVAFLDINAYWGGYGKSSELYTDIVHPNQKGHDNIARLLIQTLAPTAPDFELIRIEHASLDGFYSNILLNPRALKGSLKVSELAVNYLKGYRDDSVLINPAANNVYLKFMTAAGQLAGQFKTYGPNGMALTLFDGAGSQSSFQLQYNRLELYGQNRVLIDYYNTDKQNNSSVYGVDIIPRAKFANTVNFANQGKTSALADGDMYYKDNFFRGVATTQSSNGIAHSGERIFQMVHTGNSTQRITKPVLGMMMFDTALSKPIWCKTVAVVDGNGAVTTAAVWVDATGTTV